MRPNVLGSAWFKSDSARKQVYLAYLHAKQFAHAPSIGSAHFHECAKSKLGAVFDQLSVLCVFQVVLANVVFFEVGECRFTPCSPNVPTARLQIGTYSLALAKILYAISETLGRMPVSMRVLPDCCSMIPEEPQPEIFGGPESRKVSL